MPEYDESQKTPLFDLDESAYLLHGKGDIIHVMRDLAKRPDIITAYLGGGGHMLTAVLGVIPERDLVVFDYGPNEAANQKALAAERLICVTQHDRIRIKFSCGPAKRAKFQGHPALAIPLPESVYRLQRREFFRVTTPMIEPVQLVIPPGGELAEELELTAFDLSAGGIGVANPKGALEAPPGTILEQCSLLLPGHGTLLVDVQVCYHRPATLRDGREGYRTGLSFRPMPLDRNVAIQRYLHRLQLEQAAMTPH